MDEPQTSPYNLAACTEALLEVLAEARAMVFSEATPAALGDKLRFADDLVQTIRESVDAGAYDHSTAQALRYLVEQVASLRALVRPLAFSI